MGRDSGVSLGMTKMLFLNGPIGCGKSELVKYLKQRGPWVDRRCKDKLFTLTQQLFCVSEERFWEVYDNRELKESPLPDFKLELTEYNRLCKITGKPKIVRYGLPKFIEISVREAMIYVSECVVKPAFGDDYFGIARAESLQDGEWAVEDSCGFILELEPTLEKLGQENCLLIRIHGRGTFAGDSRNYIPDEVVDNTVDVVNSGTEQEFHEECYKQILHWLDWRG